MFKEHVTTKLSAYCNGELSQEEARRVGEHLLACGRCRKEYDDIKLGVLLAERLPEVTAPASLWSEIESLLDAQAPKTVAEKKASLFTFPFGWKSFAVAAALLLVMLGVATVWYNARLSNQIEDAKKSIAGDTVHPGVDPPGPPPNTPDASKPESNKPAPSTPPAPGIADGGKAPRPEKRTTQPAAEPPGAASRDVARLAGAPKVGATELADVGKISVGEWLETDKTSRARITIGRIGHVDVAPSTRIRLVQAKEDEHRLALAVGEMHAKINAPPRIFFVDTPTAEAIDLGCEYTLTVDESGASVLSVQSGWVAFVNNGRESLVPQGALAITRRGFAPGTPYFADASNRFKEALTRFDFANGGKPALDVLLQEARERDTLTLWHLLTRVDPADRVRLFERMVAFVPLPDDVTREGILSLDKEMLRLWKLDLEVEWYRKK